MSRYTLIRLDPAADPRGAQVSLHHRGRIILGDVTGSYYDTHDQMRRLIVRYFNGDPWPLDPIAQAVTLLDRTYTPGDEP